MKEIIEWQFFKGLSVWSMDWACPHEWEVNSWRANHSIPSNHTRLAGNEGSNEERLIANLGSWAGQWELIDRHGPGAIWAIMNSGADWGGLQDAFMASVTAARRLLESTPSGWLWIKLTLLDGLRGLGDRSIFLVELRDRVPSCCSQALHASSFIREAILQPFSGCGRGLSTVAETRLMRNKLAESLPWFRMSGRLASGDEIPTLPAAGRSK